MARMSVVWIRQRCTPRAGAWACCFNMARCSPTWTCLRTSPFEALVRDIVLMKLHAVGLRGARDLMPAQISGGMARRVALARSMALDPELVMYDEPFAGLDPISLGTTAQLIRQLNDAMGLTTILVSHDLEATLRLADHVIILGPGVIAAQGTPEEVMQSTDALVHQFVNALPTGPVPFHYPGPDVAQDFGAINGDAP